MHTERYEWLLKYRTAAEIRKRYKVLLADYDTWTKERARELQDVRAAYLEAKKRERDAQSQEE